MASVGNGQAGRTLIGTGVTSSPTFAAIGTSSGLTDNGVVISNGLGAFTATNSGAAGQLLQSGGNADPAYTSATYPTNTTVNQLLYSSATDTVSGLSTANNGTLITSATGVPSYLANGTTGQVLTATTGSPPSWGSAPSSFAPNTTIQLIDDFIGVNTPTTAVQYSNYTWTAGGGSVMTYGTTVGDSGHNGVLTNAVFTNANAAQLFLNEAAGAPAPQMILGGGAITLNWVFKLATLSIASPRYILRCGFGDTSAAAQANGVYFEYSDNVNSGQWQFITAKASVLTTSNSTIAANTSYHNFQITINAAGTSCAFFIDGVSLGTAITTNIPVLAITPFFMCKGSVGNVAASSVMVDLFYMTQTLTTPR